MLSRDPECGTCYYLQHAITVELENCQGRFCTAHPSSLLTHTLTHTYTHSSTHKRAHTLIHLVTFSQSQSLSHSGYASIPPHPSSARLKHGMTRQKSSPTAFHSSLADSAASTCDTRWWSESWWWWWWFPAPRDPFIQHGDGEWPSSAAQSMGRGEHA